MKSAITVKPEKERLVNLLEDIEKGEIRIPVFQRSLVWTETQMKDLFDSIKKGYPIGSLLIWSPKEHYKCYDTFGPYQIIPTDVKNTKYILDGSQRLSTLFGTLTNPKKFSKESAELKKFTIYYNLKDEEFTYIKTRKNDYYYIPLYKIVDTFEYLDFLNTIQKESNNDNEKEILINNAKKISKILIDYEIPYTIINGGDINGAVEIFSRVNSKGTDISEDWMLSALSYNRESDFLLGDRITIFLNKMQRYNFHNLKRDIILDTIASASDSDKAYFDVKVEDLAKMDKDEFEWLTDSTLRVLEQAIIFLYHTLGVIDYKLLPYPSQLVFISDFFRLNDFPSNEHLEKLKQWFWITSYSNYFTIYSLSQQRRAYQIFRSFAKGDHPNGIYKYDDGISFKTQPFPKRIDFGSVRSKSLQLFLIKNIRNDGPILNEQESLKEQFIFYERDKSVGNILLRLSSEFEQGKKDVEDFIINDPDRERYFINDAVATLYSSKDIFLAVRQELIMKQEATFVLQLGIDFTT